MSNKIAGTRSVYLFKDLSEEAKEKARDWYREGNDNPMMQSHMINLLKEKLDERGIKYDVDSIDVRYSLSYSQGDGFMFEGDIEWRKRTIRVKHSGHYYHSKSRSMEVIEGEELSDAEMGQFEAVYESVCDEMERVGYDEIEYENSAENIDEVMEANEYTFTKQGKRMDADEEEKEAEGPFLCPLCEADTITREDHNGTHIWKCGECPFIGLEFVSDKDIKNLKESIV